MAGDSWDESHFPHFLGENDGKQMDLSPSARSGTAPLQAACVRVIWDLPRLPEHCLQRWVYNLAISLWAKESTDAFCMARAGRCGLNKPLFRSMRLCHFEGRKKLFQPPQLIRYGLVNQHGLFTRENAERGWKQSTTSTCKNSLPGEEVQWPSLEVFKNQEWNKTFFPPLLFDNEMYPKTSSHLCAVDLQISVYPTDGNFWSR